jgi:hypothetical protein
MRSTSGFVTSLPTVSRVPQLVASRDGQSAPSGQALPSQATLLILVIVFSFSLFIAVRPFRSNALAGRPQCRPVP